MNRRSDPGLGQWTITFIVIGLVLLIIYKLIEYSSVRAYMPTGMVIAGVEVGGYDERQVEEILRNRYEEAPVVIFHNNERLEINPVTDAGFEIDAAAMISEAKFQREQQDYWSGFLGYILGRPIEVEAVELRAQHNRDTLRDTLIRIANELDEPAQPPQPVPATLSFLYGEVGRKTNISQSLNDVEAALYRPLGREARLIIEPVEAPAPNINLLASLIVNHLEGFPGVVSIYIKDLQSDRELNINGDVAMSGMSIIKVPIVLEFYRLLDQPPNEEQALLIRETLLESGNLSANRLLAMIAGQENPFLGADQVTAFMQKLGLTNTFIVTPYEEQPRPSLETLETIANQRPDINTDPDPGMQTTAEDMGILLTMLYYCAEFNGGALIAAFEGQITQQECQSIIDIMGQNFIGSLIEEGVPAETRVAHKHGWISDTHGDAGIVYTPNGNYVIIQYMHQANWLEWAVSSPLMADISRATYNYFNFDTPYLGTQVSN